MVDDYFFKWLETLSPGYISNLKQLHFRRCRESRRLSTSTSSQFHAGLQRLDNLHFVWIAL
jgi:hypothetical protein